MRAQKGKQFAGNFYTKRGHILEEEAIELYEAIIRGCGSTARICYKLTLS